MAQRFELCALMIFKVQKEMTNMFLKCENKLFIICMNPHASNALICNQDTCMKLVCSGMTQQFKPI